jgi:D-sedoheptulose 7-phosphate isomerase
MKIKELSNVLNKITDKQVDALTSYVKEADSIFLVGNGGSNAIASHMAVDYMKFLNKRCFVPNASDLVTMMVNDYGREEMYSRFIEYYYTPNEKQLAILISSSGKSINILSAAERCDTLQIPTILLSGFNKTNPLNSSKFSNTVLKYWVNSKSYGVVEMAHHSFLHAIV